MTRSAPSTDFDPFDAGYLEDPYPALARMRSHTPVAYAPSIGCYVLTKYADVDAVLLDVKTFSSARPTFSFAPLCPEALDAFRNRIGPNVTSFCDPPKHTQVRRHNMRVMSARRLNLLEPSIRLKASALIDAFAGAAQTDLVASLAFPLPALTIYSLIGFPEADPGHAEELGHRSPCDDGWTPESRGAAADHGTYGRLLEILPGLRRAPRRESRG